MNSGKKILVIFFLEITFNIQMSISGSLFDSLIFIKDIEREKTLDDREITNELIAQFDKQIYTDKNSQLKSEESRLRMQLMSEYSPDIRPVLNASTVTLVNISLSNIQVINMVIKNNFLL